MNKMWMSIALCASVLASACGPDCQTTCEKLYAQGGECDLPPLVMSSGSKIFQRCTETCESALKTHWDAGDYNPQEKTPSSQSIELVNDQQAALWMDCVEEKIL